MTSEKTDAPWLASFGARGSARRRRPQPPLIVREEPPANAAWAEQDARCGEADALRRLARGLEPLVTGLELYLAEARAALAELDEAINEQSRARLKGLARGLGEILDWCGAGTADARELVDRACDGATAVNLPRLMEEVAIAVRRAIPGFSIAAAMPPAGLRTVAPAAELAELLWLALILAGCGDVLVEWEDAGEEAVCRLTPRGSGRPRSAGSPAAERLRRLAEARGVTLAPVVAAGGTGLALRFALVAP
jgi:hypothetical protein